MKKCKNEKGKKYKKTIQVCTLSAFCLTAATGGLIMENTYADEILLIPNVTQSESQSDTQSQNANNESYVQIISERILKEQIQWEKNTFIVFAVTRRFRCQIIRRQQIK